MKCFEGAGCEKQKEALFENARFIQNLLRNANDQEA